MPDDVWGQKTLEHQVVVEAQPAMMLKCYTSISREHKLWEQEKLSKAIFLQSIFQKGGDGYNITRSMMLRW